MQRIFGLYFAVALVLTSFFLACIIFIRLQPYDDADLRAFLTAPEGCPVPCFIGIRPGQTTVEEAMKRLYDSGWVKTFSQEALSIQWVWSGQQPEWIDLTRDSRMWIRENRVMGIGIATTLRFGQLWLSYGFPDHGRLLLIPEFNLGVGYRGLYLEDGFVVEARAACPEHGYRTEYVWFTFPSNLLSFVPENPLDDASTPREISRSCSRWSSR